jgi:REP element-mobilizing transposase RayT
MGVALCGNPNNWPRFNGKLWQRNYYEHIIRGEQSYERIANYIINNSAKWNEDKFHNQNENE